MLYSHTIKLVRFYPGVDGLKTGFTDTSGYCLTATALKNNLRLISVIMKSSSSEIRNAETAKLLNYGFNSYKLTMIHDNSKSIGKIKITNSKNEYNNVYLEKPATELQNIGDDDKSYNFKIIMDKVKAPIKKGKIIGKVNVIDNNGIIVDTVGITVISDIKKANIWDYIKRNLDISTGGKIILKV